MAKHASWNDPGGCDLTERDLQGGRDQAVSVEDSMGRERRSTASSLR